MYELLKIFFISGISITIIATIANKIPKIGAFLYALPIQFLISIIILYKNTKEQNLIFNLTKQSLLSILIVFSYIFLLNLLIKKYNVKKSIILSFIFLIFCYIIYYFI